jgi:hypothetical protein
MSSKKLTKSHTSARKKALPRSKKAAAKASKSAAKSKTAKKKNDEVERRRKREELALKIFRWAYEANQRGEFQRL